MSFIIPRLLFQKVTRSTCRTIRYALVAFAFITISAGLALSDNGGYVVYPANTYDRDSTSSVYERETKQVSFFELPLWIKMFNLSSGLSALASLVILLPLGMREIKVITDQKRKKILEYISGNPGCALSDIIKQGKVPRGTVRYHIDRLRDEGKIMLIKAGKYLRLFAKSRAIGEKEKSLQSFVHNKNYRRLLFAILQKDGITNGELSEKISMDKSLTYRYIQKLLENKVISFKAEGKTKRYYIKEENKPIIIEMLTNKNTNVLKSIM